MRSVIPANRPVPVIDPINDGRHQLRDLPLERESIPYVVTIAEHGVAAFIYTWVDKNNLAGSVFVAYGPGVGPAPIVEKVDLVEMPAGANFNDWKVGAVHLRQDLQLKTATIEVVTPRAKFEARYEALHPAYAYSSHPDGCPAWAATNRIEQAGRIKGTLTIDGRAMAFDTTAARDHSWGTRDWQVPQHWKWLHAQAGTDLCVHFWQIQAYGRTDLRGFVLRDGRMAEVTEVEIDLETDDQYRQTRIDAVVHDNAGRTSRVTGEYFAHFPLIPGPHTTLNEGALKCRIDDRPGVGWTEVMWPTAYLDYLLSIPKG
jgi:hypothetical protein